MNSPTIIEQPSAALVEAARAKFWRKSVMKLTRKQLAEHTGYSVAAISLFEQGHDHKGRVLGARAWRRYRLVCAGLVGMRGSAWVTTGSELRAWMDEKGYDE